MFLRALIFLIFVKYQEFTSLFQEEREKEKNPWLTWGPTFQSQPCRMCAGVLGVMTVSFLRRDRTVQSLPSSDLPSLLVPPLSYAAAFASLSFLIPTAFWKPTGIISGFPDSQTTTALGCLPLPVLCIFLLEVLPWEMAKSICKAFWMEKKDKSKPPALFDLRIFRCS